tara:strand:- start:374 stop:586 length:213 start_codon:yes stop_codon:yes gene_type:complete
MTDLQLAAIISQAMFVGTVHESHKVDKDFDEIVFRNYARGMLTILMKELNVYSEDVIDKALDDFSAMGKI